MITWDYVQQNSADILESGLEKLKLSPKHAIGEPAEAQAGNYLISSEDLYYIGEAKSLKARLKQHAVAKSSTFYKNYLKLCAKEQHMPEGLSLGNFQYQAVTHNIGRKEIEQHGIVNLPARLNQFQKDKAKLHSGAVSAESWESVQESSGSLLLEGEDKLLRVDLTPWFDTAFPKGGGLYWVEHVAEGLIYIGESSELDKRLKTHSTYTYFSALRRHIGENILGFELQVRKGKKRFFNDPEDESVTKFLRECVIRVFPVRFGRYELEESLIKKHSPLLNRKDNKKK